MDRRGVAAAFKSELKWEALQYDPTIPIFGPVVPHIVAGSVAAGYEVQQQPDDFPQERYNLDFSGLGRIVLLIQVAAGALGLVLLWALFRFIRWLVR